MSSRFILYTSPSIGYKESFFFSHIHEYERISTFPFELPSEFFRSRTSARTEDRESRPPEPRPCLRHLLGCVGRSGFWGAYRGATARSFPAIAIFIDSSFARLICDSNRLRVPPTSAARIPASVVHLYEGLHCEPRPAPNLYDYFKQRTMATGANGAAGAFGTGPSAGYILILFLFTGFLAMLTGNVENAKTGITYLLLFSRLIWIKFNMNMPKFLTPHHMFLSPGLWHHPFQILLMLVQQN